MPYNQWKLELMSSNNHKIELYLKEVVIIL